MWGRRRRVRRTRVTTVTKHYVAHKEAARERTLARLHHFNQHYNFTWNRVAIRNQRRCWGSCSAKKNLNFNYKILFLPEHLRDYIIVHELCHLKELNHGKVFWNLVAEQIPDFKKCVAELRTIDNEGHRKLIQNKMPFSRGGENGQDGEYEGLDSRNVLEHNFLAAPIQKSVERGRLR